MIKQHAIISLGSNLGNRLELLQKALILLENQSIQIKTLSSIYETPAWGFESTPFYNACAEIETDFTPEALLLVFLKIEKQLGRFRNSSAGYSARQLDIDLLFYGDLLSSAKNLILPHPRLHLRNFVLVPLHEIAPYWLHPGLNATVEELLHKSTDRDQLKKLPFEKWSPSIFNSFSYITIEGNIGVGKSNGNYISFLDSDDYWDSKKLDKQINKFKKNLNLDLVYCDQYLLKDGAKMSSNKKMINSSILNELINGWTAPNTSTLMYRKESFERVGGFDEKLKSCQDHDLWFKIASENFNVDYVDEPLSFFVIDSENRISYHLKNRMDGVMMFLNNVKNYFPQKKKYLIFKKKYIFKTSFPLFVSVIKKKKYLSATKVYCKYLMFNSHFYKKIKETIIKKLNKI